MRKKMIILDDKTSMPEDRQENRPVSLAVPAQQAAAGETDGLCITSLVLGCCSFMPYVGFVTGILALVFGIKGLRRVRSNGMDGEGLAIAGIVLGSVAILFWLVVGLFLVIALSQLRM